MNTPVSSSVTLLTDPPFEAKLREDIVDGDSDSVLRDEVRVFHGLSVSGDVTGKYVYAGYGQKKDFDLLQEKGAPAFRRFLGPEALNLALNCRNRLLRQNCNRQVWSCFQGSQDQR